MTTKNNRPRTPEPTRERALVEEAWQQAEAARRAEEELDSAVTGSGGAIFAGPPPDSFTGYKILRELHRGGQGIVYQAIQEATRRKVAIKFMREGPFAGAAERARFDREVQVLGQLNHPHIVTIHDTGSAAGHLYFVMDYIPGQSLDLYMADGEHTVDETLGLFGKICEAVNAAHLRGVIHRDLKPGNIRIDTGGEPRVLDFGLAKVALSEAEASAMTMTGQFVGSLPWASPEQAEGIPSKIDLRTDVYALGVMLYQMLTARFPYDVTGNMRDVLDNILNAEPARPRAIRKQIDDEVETIVLKCLQKERERRYQTAGELGRDVRHYLRGEPIEAKRDSGWYVLKKTLRRYRVPSAVAAGFVVLITASTVALGLLYREADEARDQAQIIANFQSSMLAQTDAEGMGLAIVDGFEDRIRAVLAERIQDQGELDRVMHDWRQRTLKAGPINVALSVLDEFVLAKAAETIEKDFADQPLVRAALQQTVASTYRDIGLYEPALPLQEAALQTRREELGDDRQDTLGSINSMGGLLKSMGKLAEAEPYHREALKGARRVLGEDHPDTLASIANMGTLLQELGKNEEALPYYREALEGSRRVLGDDHRSTLASINNMSILLHSMGKLTEAEGYSREALQGQRRIVGNDHPDTLQSINNMAELLKSMGKLEEAEPYSREALEGQRRVLGDEHPGTLGSINNMGTLLQLTGKHDEALPYFREALEGYRRVLGNDHPTTLTSINNMGTLLQAMGKYAEAERYHREALDGFRRVLGDDHPSTLMSINNMGQVFYFMGRLADAEQYWREALEGCRRVLGSDHPNTLASINNMAALLQKMGKNEEALRYFRESLEGCRRLLGNDHRSTLTSINNVGMLLQSMDKLDEAEPYIREAAERGRRVLGDDHPDTLIWINNMGLVLQKMGRLDEAEPYFREALEGFRRLLGDEHPDTLASINSMGSLLQSMGKYVEAEPYIREALNGRRRLLGDDHPDTLNSIYNMGRSMHDLGRFEEAEALGAEAVQRAREIFPSGHWVIGLSLTAYGKTLSQLKRFADAEAVLLEGCEIQEAALGTEHRHAVTAIIELIDLYVIWDATEPGNSYANKAVTRRAKLPPPERAASLIKLGMRLLEDGRPAEAEAPLRECLEIRQEVLAEGHWLIFNTTSVLGESLAGQAADPSLALRARIEKLREAEPLLLEGYEGLKDNPDAPDVRKREALQRIIKLYETWDAAEPEKGHDAKAAEWRAKLPKPPPATSQPD